MWETPTQTHRQQLRVVDGGDRILTRYDQSGRLCQWRDQTAPNSRHRLPILASGECTRMLNPGDEHVRRDSGAGITPKGSEGYLGQSEMPILWANPDRLHSHDYSTSHNKICRWRRHYNPLSENERTPPRSYPNGTQR